MSDVMRVTPRRRVELGSMAGDDIDMTDAVYELLFKLYICIWISLER